MQRTNIKLIIIKF